MFKLMTLNNLKFNNLTQQHLHNLLLKKVKKLRHQKLKQSNQNHALIFLRLLMSLIINLICSLVLSILDIGLMLGTSKKLQKVVQQLKVLHTNLKFILGNFMINPFLSLLFVITRMLSIIWIIQSISKITLTKIHQIQNT